MKNLKINIVKKLEFMRLQQNSIFKYVGDIIFRGEYFCLKWLFVKTILFLEIC